jgi:hypothetical protein
MGVDPSYSWNDARAEVEFILANDEGAIFPIEVIGYVCLFIQSILAVCD